MLRSAASPGSVGFGRSGRGLSGLLVSAAFRPATQSKALSLGWRPIAFVHGTIYVHRHVGDRRARRTSGLSPCYLILLSLNSTCLRATGSYFLKTSFSVWFRGFLLRYVIIAGARAAHELDLLRDGLCHFILTSRKFARTLLATTGKSRPPRQRTGPLPNPSKLSIFSFSALGSKPCISSAHCRPTSAPLITGRSRSASNTVSGSQITSCTHSGGR